MKVTTNFCFPFDRLILVFVGMGWGLAVLGFLLVVTLVFSASRFTKENPILKSRLEELRHNPVVETKPAFMPSAGDMADLSGRLHILNGMGAGSGKPLSALLARLEKLLPSGARLLNFHGDQSTGEVQLTVEAVSLEDLSKLLTALENDGTFSKVNLTKQSRSLNDKGAWVQFSVDMIGSPP